MTNSEILPSGRSKIHHLEMRGVTKRFPGVLANDCVDFDVCAGEVHALLGENGAGKSTLMKVLYGMYEADGGEIWLNGQRVSIDTPTDAINLGIGMIHQHFMLVQTLTVAENVALGLPSSRGPLTDLDRVSKRIRELGEIYGLPVDPDAHIWQLAVGQRQRVEIIKALYRGAALLILDEPTAVLTPQEVEEFFGTLRQMVRDGHAIIFISHKLHEVIDISNRVTVLRDGKRVDSCETEGCTKADLARMMVGREVTMKPDRADLEQGQVRLALKNLYVASDRGTPALRGVDLDVQSGDILEGQDITNNLPGSITDRQLAYIPEERMKDGMIHEFSVAENMILRDHHKEPFSRNGFLLLRIIAQFADKLIQRFQVRTPSRETPAKNLSGGNIQKVVLARELSREPRVLIAAQPTRGVDIGATEYVHAQLLGQRQAGTAILLISEDLDEILALSDRIAVIYEGQIMGVVGSETATPEQLGLLMAGVKED
jgi:ABC-type uncharacterized transport system ATPase subunit